MSKNIRLIGEKAKKAIQNKIDSKTKDKVLKDFIFFLENEKKKILKQNKKDIKFAQKKKLKPNLIDRLILTPKKLNSTKKSVRDIIKLNDPVDKVLEKWKRPNGLIIKKVSTPIGIIGVVYESRPNVTSDISCLCFKSGNAVILRGGSEAINTNKILASLFRKALITNKVNPDFVQFINNRNKKNIGVSISPARKQKNTSIPASNLTVFPYLQHFCNFISSGSVST